MQLQLYLHFPFCKRKCFYCDFCSAPGCEEEIDAYCAALEKEIRMEGALWPEAQVNTVFFGGGTPSIVPPKAMVGVLDALRESFSFSHAVEFTSEANPGTLKESWLELMKRYGMNRLSLGVQAAQDELLRRLGRIHTFQEARQAASMVKNAGISNLSVDMMFALPGQTLDMYKETIDKVCELEPKHLSAYSLIVEDGTPLQKNVESGAVTVPDDDEAADFYLLGLEKLREQGYHQYEISNFAQAGFTCRHNAGYWQGAWYLGLGVSAHSMLPPGKEEAEKGAVRLRRANQNDVKSYMNAIEEGETPPRDRQWIDRKEAMFEAMMTGLRMNEGVSNVAFQSLFGVSLQNAFGEQLDSLVKDGLGQWNGNGGFALTPHGLMVQNEALLRLMDNMNNS
ncbi:MAG: radical SAM family heme chaperone HemW [Eubacteriales bacterium]|nr:radical SAM family heme chaperone HemW [Eubacteriales bacterium]